MKYGTQFSDDRKIVGRIICTATPVTESNVLVNVYVCFVFNLNAILNYVLRFFQCEF